MDLTPSSISFSSHLAAGAGSSVGVAISVPGPVNTGGRIEFTRFGVLIPGILAGGPVVVGWWGVREILRWGGFDGVAGVENASSSSVAVAGCMVRVFCIRGMRLRKEGEEEIPGQGEERRDLQPWCGAGAGVGSGSGAAVALAAGAGAAVPASGCVGFRWRWGLGVGSWRPYVVGGRRVGEVGCGRGFRRRTWLNSGASQEFACQMVEERW